MLIDPVVHDPPVRITISIRQSILDQIMGYEAFYRQETGNDIDRSHVLAQMVIAICTKEPKFAAFFKAWKASGTAAEVQAPVGAKTAPAPQVQPPIAAKTASPAAPAVSPGAQAPDQPGLRFD